MNEDSMPSKRRVPEIDQCPACFWHPGHEPDEWFREETELRSATLTKMRAEIATLTEQRDRAMKALRACDRYFSACARAWAADEGRIANESGHILVEAEGLDELADEAGELVGRALAALDTPSSPSLPDTAL
jgi:hypothetical protein